MQKTPFQEAVINELSRIESLVYKHEAQRTLSSFLQRPMLRTRYTIQRKRIERSKPSFFKVALHILSLFL